MIDFIYSDILGISPETIFNNDLLDFETSISLKTGELSPFNNRDRKKTGYIPKERKEAIYKDCKFIITNDKYTNFSGSLHEYYHNGINHNNFTFPELFNVIKDLHRKFNINPFLNPIHNVEFGVNVLLPFETKKVLNAIIAFKGTEYEMKTYKGRGYMIKFVFDQYELKIYDKGHQYQLPANLLRFEIKVTTMNFLHSKGISIKSTTDLLFPFIHDQLGGLLMDFFSQVLIYDWSININQTKRQERAILKEGQNPKYWTNLKNISPENYKKKVKRFKELVNKYGNIQLQKTILELIKFQWENLINVPYETYINFVNYLNEIRPETFPEITAIPKTNLPRFNPSNNTLIQGRLQEEERRVCRSCGRDISSQKVGSVFCSEKVYGKEAKRCRNIDSNPRNNFWSRENKIKSMGLLFDINPYLQPTLKKSMKIQHYAI